MKEVLRYFLLDAVERPADSSPGFGLEHVSKRSIATLDPRSRTAWPARPTATGLRVLLDRAREDGEIPVDADADSLLLFSNVLRSGLEVQARDGASHAELSAIIEVALMGWDAFSGRSRCRTVLSDASTSGPLLLTKSARDVEDLDALAPHA
jgi:hypothetical protein